MAANRVFLGGFGYDSTKVSQDEGQLYLLDSKIRKVAPGRGPSVRDTEVCILAAPPAPLSRYMGAPEDVTAPESSELSAPTPSSFLHFLLFRIC